MTDETTHRPGRDPRWRAVETLARSRRIAGALSAAVLVLAGLFTVIRYLPAIAWAVVIAIGLWPLFQRAAARWPAQRRGLLPALVVVVVLMVLILPLTVIGIPALHDAREVRGGSSKLGSRA